MTGSNLGHYLYMNSESFYETNPHHTWNCAGRVDCEKNERLAIAIAAINDENDYMQWFKHNTKNDWIKVHSLSFNEYFDEIALYYDIHNNVIDYHKATVEELINFLK